MKQSGLQAVDREGIHAAIIMDGNGRWAQARGLPRIAGHRAGADAVRRTVAAAPELGITTLTLYAFSSDNWQRPAHEVSELMKLLRTYLNREASQCRQKGIRLQVIGRRDRLPRAVRLAIETAETMTRNGDRLYLRIAVDYSARAAILKAARHCGAESDLNSTEFSRLLGAANSEVTSSPEVDLLIRTSGEQRLSDFLLWECAYAELFFTKTCWPDFSRDDLAQAVSEFYARDRRFGRINEAKAV